MLRIACALALGTSLYACSASDDPEVEEGGGSAGEGGSSGKGGAGGKAGSSGKSGAGEGGAAGAEVTGAGGAGDAGATQGGAAGESATGGAPGGSGAAGDGSGAGNAGEGGSGGDGGSSKVRPTITAVPCTEMDCSLVAHTGLPALSGDASQVVAVWSPVSAVDFVDTYVKIYDTDTGSEADSVLLYSGEEQGNAYEEAYETGSSDFHETVAARVAAIQELIEDADYHALDSFSSHGLIAGQDEEAETITVKACASSYDDPVCSDAPVLTSFAYDRKDEPFYDSDYCPGIGYVLEIGGAIDLEERVLVVYPSVNSGDLCGANDPVVVRSY